MSQVWEYNGQQFEFDIMVKDDAVRYEKAIEKVEEKAKQINTIKGMSNIIQFQCDAFYAFFDDVLGTGASDKLFKESYNLRECSEAYYDSFIPYVKKQSNDYNNYCKAAGQATPGQPNRAQRRRNKKKR